ncbi:YlxR family protein [Solihabitans fulvus]|uniref:YlxR family protein n=1 Tax=Solihabitans fulvus TaxID=1892852 RepID=A0A5B2X5I1_9PSEU|nr:YlxR family protein [Solihabitans fulvus]KAA2258597.1 YlxR family protein [Solihabitans fulvus]
MRRPADRPRRVLRHPVRLTERNEIDFAVVQRQGSVPTHIGPARTCVGCRARTLSSELLRVVVVDGALAPDIQRRLPGRGAWLHPDQECLRLAERRRAFPRALRVPGPLEVTGVRSYLEQLADVRKAQGPTQGQQEVRKQVDPS